MFTVVAEPARRPKPQCCLPCGTACALGTTTRRGRTAVPRSSCRAGCGRAGTPAGPGTAPPSPARWWWAPSGATATRQTGRCVRCVLGGDWLAVRRGPKHISLPEMAVSGVKLDTCDASARGGGQSEARASGACGVTGPSARTPGEGPATDMSSRVRCRPSLPHPRPPPFCLRCWRTQTQVEGGGPHEVKDHSAAHLASQQAETDALLGPFLNL